MRSVLIACFLAVLTTAIPAAAWADGYEHHHHHRVWRHVWYRGPSYFPIYSYYPETYWPLCAWHRSWDGYWHRDCF